MKKLLALGLLVFGMGQVIGFPKKPAMIEKGQVKACKALCEGITTKKDVCTISCEACAVKNKTFPGVIACMAKETPWL